MENTQDKPDTITALKSFRLEIDTFINSVANLNKSREVSLTHTELQRAKMWLGKCLQEMNVPTPYPQSEDAKSPVIEPQAEHTEKSLLSEWMKMDISNDQVAKIKHFRSQIQKVLDQFKVFIKALADADDVPANPFLGNAALRSFSSLEEAKMWLGWALNEIKKQQDAAMAVNPAAAIVTEK